MVTVNTTHQLLQNNLPYFAREALKIKDKLTGEIQPFILNTAQEFLHRAIERQLLLTGKVRIIIVKGRQQGMSTYVAARFYHKSTRNRGQAVFILSHEFQTTGKLFSIVDRYQQHCPEPLKPHTGVYNNKQIKFDEIDSEYTTGTAGNEDVGRGGTLQLFHGSEVGFWENTEGIETGIMQSIADAPNTEIILESTANGMGNMFHRKCMDALKGKGDYELVFIPWYWQKEYARPVPPGFYLDEQEDKLKRAFKLNDEQIYWRRKKIEDFGSTWKFRQEYPMTVRDAFIVSGDPLVDADAVMIARKTKVNPNPNAPIILGVDCGRDKDSSVIFSRKGRKAFPYIEFDPQKEGKTRQTVIAQRLKIMIERLGVSKIFIDNAKGYGVIDILVADGYGDIVQGVYFNEGAVENNKFINKRAEMHIEARDWLEDAPCEIPDEEAFEVEIAAIPNYEETRNGLIQIVAKKEIKKILGRSPNIWDAFCLTFAYRVAANIANRHNRIKKMESRSPLRTLRRVRKDEPINVGNTLNIWG